MCRPVPGDRSGERFGDGDAAEWLVVASQGTSVGVVRRCQNGVISFRRRMSAGLGHRGAAPKNDGSRPLAGQNGIDVFDMHAAWRLGGEGVVADPTWRHCDRAQWRVERGQMLLVRGTDTGLQWPVGYAPPGRPHHEREQVASARLAPSRHRRRQHQPPGVRERWRSSCERRSTPPGRHWRWPASPRVLRWWPGRQWLPARPTTRANLPIGVPSWRPTATTPQLRPPMGTTSSMTPTPTRRPLRRPLGGHQRAGPHPGQRR